MTIGIYKITNNLNGKSYIGQSIHIEQRISEHKSEAKSNDSRRKAYNSIIHKAIRKYGWNNFNISIIEECSTSKLDDRERYWIQFYNTLVPNGYNILPGWQKYRKNINSKFKKDTKPKSICPACGGEKESRSSLCLNCYRKNSKIIEYKIINIGKDAMIEKILDTSYEFVAKQFGYASGNSLKKIFKKNNWPYTKQLMFDYYFSKNKKYHPKDKRAHKKYKKVYQIDKNNYQIVDNFTLSPAECSIRGFHSGHIIECCNGKRKYYKGYIFRLTTQSIPVACYDIKTHRKIKEFSSCYEAAKYLVSTQETRCKISTARTHISEVCHNKHKTFANYQWEFIF